MGKAVETDRIVSRIVVMDLTSLPLWLNMIFSCESYASCNRGSHCYYWSLDSVLCQVARAGNDPMVPDLCKEGLVAVQVVTVTLNIQKLAY